MIRKFDRKKRHRCKECFYWLTDAQHPLIIAERSKFDEGECHACPPTASVHSTYDMGTFPLTEENDWCGMWKNIEEV